jgi:hypothetical protein
VSFIEIIEKHARVPLDCCVWVKESTHKNSDNICMRGFEEMLGPRTCIRREREREREKKRKIYGEADSEMVRVRRHI